MPELPEVETIRRQLAPLIQGAVIVGADTHWSSKFTPALDAVGATILNLSRRGKYLLFELDDGNELVAHLGMTGAFQIVAQHVAGSPSCAAHGPHTRAIWALDDGRQLIFRDIRRFGRLRVVPAGVYEDIPTLLTMGPEPLSDAFSGRSLHAALRGRSRAIKTQLLSQRPVAGVGNIYADEALFNARIDPRAHRIGPERCEVLASQIKAVLQTGIDNGGTTLRDYVDARGGEGGNQHELVAYGRAGEPCISCGNPLHSIVLDARTTTFCRTCQRR